MISMNEPIFFLGSPLCMSYQDLEVQELAYSASIFPLPSISADTCIQHVSPSQYGPTLRHVGQNDLGHSALPR